MLSRRALHSHLVLAAVVVLGCGSPQNGPPRLDASARPATLAAAGLVISTPLSLDKITVVAGEVLHATVTFQNTSSAPISIQHMTIAGRPPGGTNIGGPYCDLFPQLGAQTIQPGATLTLAASRSFSSTDPLGSWYSYVTYQDAAGGWHDSASVAFTVAKPGLVIATPLSLDKSTVVAGDTLNATVTYRNASASAVSIQHLTIAGRPPGATNIGGPYADLYPQLGPQTVQPGAMLTLAASRAFTSADPVGSWYSYVTYQDAAGGWHDTASVSFTVAQPAPLPAPAPPPPAPTPAPPPPTGGLVISAPLSLDKSTVFAGDTITGTVTYQNTSASPITIQGVTIAGRPPGGTNIGGPFADLAPKLATQTIQPGATVTFSASRTFTSADPLGAWYSYFTYQDAAGAWQDGPNVAFTVAVPIAVTVAPSTASTTTGGTIPFTASVSGTQSTAVTWSVQEPGGGSVSAAGVYMAPPVAGTYHVMATCAADATKSDLATVTVVVPELTIASPLAFDRTTASPGDVLNASVTYQNSTTAPIAIQQLKIALRPPGGTNIGGPYYDLLPQLGAQTVQPGATVTLAASHTFASSEPVGPWYSYATWQDASGGWHDGPNVNLTVVQLPPPPPAVAVAISPDPASVDPGGALTFTATVTGLATGQSANVTWAVLEPTGGTVSASGIYSAPTTIGTYHVVATSVADPSKSDTAAVSVGQFTLIPAQRLTTWNPGIAGGVPARTTVCATVNASTYGSGTLDATGGIQAALNACPVGQVVQLSAGDFKVTSTLQITKGIVLRGMGPTQTRLKMPVGTSANVVTVGTQWFKFGPSVNLASDAVKGTQSVVTTVSPGVSPGELVVVDQLTNTAITEWSTKSPPGDVSRTWFTRPNRPVGQVLEVQSVSGNAVTFSTPFHIDFQTAFSAQLTRFAAPVVKFGGLEDLYVYGGSGGQGNVWLENAAYSWIKNVESDFQDGPSIAIDASFRCIVRDSYVHSTQTPSPGGGGYGFSFSWYSADNLLENNISWNMNKVMVMRASGGGNVIAYNYMDDGWIDYSPGWVETGINASHMTCPHYELFEGNQSFNFDGDNTWGNAVYITVFRNHFTGRRRSAAPLTFTDTQNMRAIGLMEGHKWYSFVGNVLGTAGQPTAGYVLDAPFPWTDNPVGMWRLGYNPENWAAPPDPNVTGTVIREGNFDYVTKQVRWGASGAQALPTSLYLTSKPAFFGTNPWPWVDSTGTVKTATLPARARFDAMHP